MKRAAACILAMFAASCVDLQHINPLDVNAPVVVTVTPDRDTLTAVGQTVTFKASAGPEYPTAPISWSLGFAPPSGISGASIVGTGPTFDYQWVLTPDTVAGGVTVTAWVGPHSTSYTVHFRQRLGSVKFNSCPKVCFAFMEVGSGAVGMQELDSLGSPMGGAYQDVVAKAVSRNPAVAVATSDGGDGALLYSALSPGNTWIVVPGVVPDSTHVYVDYRPDTVAVTCQTSIPKGTQAQFTAKVLSANRVELTMPTYLTWKIDAVDGAASVDGTGLVTATQAGQVAVIATEGITGLAKGCLVDITP